MTPVLAFHPQDLLAIAAVIVLWAVLSRMARGRRRRPTATSGADAGPGSRGAGDGEA